MCLREGEREVPERLTNLGVQLNPLHPPPPPPIYFFLGRESTLGAEGAEAKIEENNQLHYQRPPSIEQ